MRPCKPIDEVQIFERKLRFDAKANAKLAMACQDVGQRPAVALRDVVLAWLDNYIEQRPELKTAVEADLRLRGIEDATPGNRR